MIFIPLIFKKWKTNFTDISVVVIGFLFNVNLSAYFVVDLFLVLEKMSETAKTVTTTDRGYRSITFLLKVALLLKAKRALGYGILFIKINL